MSCFEVSEFLQHLSASNLVTLNSVYELEDIKYIKNTILCKGRCRSCNTSKWFCSKCNKLNKLLCRSYHNQSAFEELIVRLVYEYMFDMLTLDDIMSGRWLEICKRDFGHHERIQRLIARVPPNRLATCRWLAV